MKHAALVHPESTISPKVSAPVIAGAAATIICWLILEIAKVDVPGPVALAIGTVLTGLLGFSVKDPLRMHVPPTPGEEFGANPGGHYTS